MIGKTLAFRWGTFTAPSITRSSSFWPQCSSLGEQFVSWLGQQVSKCLSLQESAYPNIESAIYTASASQMRLGSIDPCGMSKHCILTCQPVKGLITVQPGSREIMAGREWWCIAALLSWQQQPFWHQRMTLPEYKKIYSKHRQYSTLFQLLHMVLAVAISSPNHTNHPCLLCFSTLICACRACYGTFLKVWQHWILLRSQIALN